MLNPILWHNGLPLEPQHFQQSDLYHQNLISQMNHYLHPFSWGIVDKLFIPENLKKGNIKGEKFSIDKGAFLFKDYTLVKYNREDIHHGNSVLVKSIRLDDIWLKKTSHLKQIIIYVALKKIKYTSKNVTEIHGADVQNDELKDLNIHTRFVVTYQKDDILNNKCLDIHFNEGDAKEVRKLKYALEIIDQTQLSSDKEDYCIPIARISRMPDDELYFDETFIAPTVTVDTSERLIQIIRDVQSELKIRSSILEKFKKNKGIDDSDFSPKRLNYLLYYKTLNKFYGRISHTVHLLEIPRIHLHPLSIYEIMIDFIAEMSTFSEEVSALGIHKRQDKNLVIYDHNDLYTCFNSAQGIIEEFLKKDYSPELIIKLIRVESIRKDPGKNNNIINKVKVLPGATFVNVDEIEENYFTNKTVMLHMKTNNETIPIPYESPENHLIIHTISKIDDIVKKSNNGLRLKYNHSNKQTKPFTHVFQVIDISLLDESYVGFYWKDYPKEDVQISLHIY